MVTVCDSESITLKGPGLCPNNILYVAVSKDDSFLSIVAERGGSSDEYHVVLFIYQ